MPYDVNIDDIIIKVDGEYYIDCFIGTAYSAAFQWTTDIREAIDIKRLYNGLSDLVRS